MNSNAKLREFFKKYKNIFKNNQSFENEFKNKNNFVPYKFECKSHHKKFKLTDIIFKNIDYEVLKTNSCKRLRS